MMLEDLRYKESWNGEYRNVRYEIIKWKLGDNPCWNYYLYLPIAQIPVEYHKYFILKGKYEKMSPDSQAHLYYNYTNQSYVSDLDWHGGITLYEKILDGAGKLIGVRLGCDYAHYFDEQAEYSYNLNYVQSEAKRTIDKLHTLIPNLKVACRWDGKYYDRSEVEPLPKGGFIAIKNKEAWHKR